MRESREQALRILYEADARGESPSSTLARSGATATKEAVAILDGVTKSVGDLDRLIGQVSVNWSIERMPIVDRNVLRIGAWELRSTDTPTAVIINEAIEIAREYSEEESGAFVNGILSSLAASLRPGAGEPAPPGQRSS